MANNINAGLNVGVLARETTFGVAPLDFEGTDIGYGINQSFENPINVIDTAEKEVIKSTFGSQIQKNNVILQGNDIVTSNFSHQIGINDFAVLGAMFFQNGYEFVATIVDGAITAIVNNVDEVTITLTDAGTLETGDIIQISGRTVNTDENGRYIVKSVSTNDIVIDFVGGFDAELLGTVTAELNKHIAKIEDVNDCQKQLLDSSYSIYLPRKFSKDVCAVGEGEIYTGVVPKTLNLNFLDATYTIDTMGKELITDSNNLPVSDAQYKPISNFDGYVRKNVPTVKDMNGDVLEALELTLDVELGTEDSQKVRKAGTLNRAVVDGVSVKGNWKMLFLTEDDASNYSASLYANRKSVHNEAPFSVGVENTDGSSVFITGNLNFMNETVTKETGGWVLSLDFEALRTVDYPNVVLEVVNGYSTTMAELFRS